METLDLSEGRQADGTQTRAVYPCNPDELAAALWQAAELACLSSYDASLPEQLRAFLRDLDLLLARASGWVKGTA